MLRNNQASAVHIISVFMEDAPYICTICPYFILRPREHSNQTSSASTENKAQLIPSVFLLFPFLYATYRKNIFFLSIPYKYFFLDSFVVFICINSERLF